MGYAAPLFSAHPTQARAWRSLSTSGAPLVPGPSPTPSLTETTTPDPDAHTHCVINFYHLAPIAKPGATAKNHRAFIKEQGWDIRGRIYVSFQGMNAQFSGPAAEAEAYTKWVAAQPEIDGLKWRSYPVRKHMFPKLRLKFKPNLISLQGGMADLPVVGAILHANLAPSTLVWSGCGPGT